VSDVDDDDDDDVDDDDDDDVDDDDDDDDDNDNEEEEEEEEEEEAPYLLLMFCELSRPLSLPCRMKYGNWVLAFTWKEISWEYPSFLLLPFSLSL